ncbi:molybdopterin dinucleotide binding domain-containing protein, partial [Klebsiella pneumoniae]|uniref:molybdopterin dinucleotide binding domain-containing protein n=1 Tax=Klebsiella pneumoniae TaxID=573 RepID=UPI00272F602C
SQLNHTALRERYAVAGRDPVTIHPQDAQARGIVDGDLVRVWNARGQVLAGAVVTEGIRPGVLSDKNDAAVSAQGICQRHSARRNQVKPKKQ